MERTFRIEKKFSWQGEITDKVAGVMRMFGLDVARLRDSPAVHRCRITLCPGDVCYITGPSGAGKSVLLRELYKAMGRSEKIDLNNIRLPADRSVVDCIKGSFFESLEILSKAGLNDVFCVLNQPSRLSDGQKYRFRLAKALDSGRKVIFADEFCSSLDRVTAAVVAYNVRKFAKQHKVIFILAGCDNDILPDLMPDVIVVKHLVGKTEVVYRDR